MSLSSIFALLLVHSISEYIIKIWFGISASDQENHIQMCYQLILFDALTSYVSILKLFVHKY